MKRHTDVPRRDAPADKRKKVDVPSQPHHAASHDDRPGRAPVDTGVTTKLRALHTRAEPATPVEAAAALIELCLHESNGPVEELSGALARMAQLVQGRPGDDDIQAHRAQLAREVAVCIENLQFHDRLTQQLTQVRNLLATLAFSDVTAFTPIVNYPEVAILGLSRSNLQPVVREGAIVPRLMMPLSLTYDHRVIDGADGCRFTTRLAQLFSDPLRLLMET